MTELQKQMIILMAQKNMRVSDVSRRAGMTRSQVDTALQQIKRTTKLDPQNFFDLHELYKMVTSEVSNLDTSPDTHKIKNERRQQ